MEDTITDRVKVGNWLEPDSMDLMSAQCLLCLNRSVSSGTALAHLTEADIHGASFCIRIRKKGKNTEERERKGHAGQVQLRALRKGAQDGSSSTARPRPPPSRTASASQGVCTCVKMS
eukprot:79753-Pelagomonas_calceolata.AAC.9